MSHAMSHVQQVAGVSEVTARRALGGAAHEAPITALTCTRGTPPTSAREAQSSSGELPSARGPGSSLGQSPTSAASTAAAAGSAASTAAAAGSAASTAAAGILGISVEFLRKDFQDEVKEKLAKGLDSDYYEVNEAMLFGDNSRGHGLICPRDMEKECSYVDAVHQEEKDGVPRRRQSRHPGTGPATLMLSWTWGTTVAVVVGAIVRFCEINGRDETKTFVWQCALCNNQSRVEDAKKAGTPMQFREFEEKFKKPIVQTREILAVFDCWHSPGLLKRSWCLYEANLAVTYEATYSVAIPLGEEKSMWEALSKDGMQPLLDAFNAVDVKNAQAFAREDRDQILRSIDPNIDPESAAVSEPCKQLGVKIVKKMRVAFCRAVYTMFNDKITTEPVAYKVVDNVAWVLSTPEENGWVEKTREVYEKGREQPTCKVTSDYVCLILQYRFFLHQIGKGDADTQQLRQKLLKEATSTVPDTEDVSWAPAQIQLLRTQAFEAKLKKRYKDEFDHLKRAVEVAERYPHLKKLRADTLKSAGNCQKNPNKAESLRSAKLLLNKASAAYAACCFQLAVQLSWDNPEERNQDVEAQVADLMSESEEVYESLAMEHGESYARFLFEYGEHHRRRHNFPEAEDKFLDALKVFGVERGGSLDAVVDRNRVHVGKCLAGLAKCALSFPDNQFTASAEGLPEALGEVATALREQSARNARTDEKLPASMENLAKDLQCTTVLRDAGVYVGGQYLVQLTDENRVEVGRALAGLARCVMKYEAAEFARREAGLPAALASVAEDMREQVQRAGPGALSELADGLDVVAQELEHTRTLKDAGVEEPTPGKFLLGKVTDETRVRVGSALAGLADCALKYPGPDFEWHVASLPEALSTIAHFLRQQFSGGLPDDVLWLVRRMEDLEWKLRLKLDDNQQPGSGGKGQQFGSGGKGQQFGSGGKGQQFGSGGKGQQFGSGGKGQQFGSGGKGQNAGYW